MTPGWVRRCQDLSARCYRFLLHAYPQPFLKEYREQLDQSFRDLAREQIPNHGFRGLVTLWARVLPDLFLTAARHRATAITETQVAVVFSIVFWLVPFLLIAPLLLLLIYVAGAAAMLTLAVVLAARGRRAPAFRTVKRLGVGAAAYLSTLLVLPLVIPGKTVPVGESFCPDAVCIVVERVAKSPVEGGILYNVEVRATSNSTKALDYSKREWTIYLRDDERHRFSSTEPKSISGFILQPSESRTFVFAFIVPRNVRHLFFEAEDLGTPRLLGLLHSFSLVTGAPKIQIQ